MGHLCAEGIVIFPSGVVINRTIYGNMEVLGGANTLREGNVGFMSGTIRRQFKICLIGDGYVGKTSARRKFLDKTFKTNYIPTLGVDFARKSTKIENYQVDLIIWDIAGQPLFQNLRNRYYDGASGLVLVYSVVNRESFENARKWVEEAKGFMGKIPSLVVLGNKVDLRSRYAPNEVVTFEEGQKFAQDLGIEMRTSTYFTESSALTGENIDEAFNELTKMMLGIELPSSPLPEPKPTPSPSPQIDLSKTSEEETVVSTENDTEVVGAHNHALAIQLDLDPTTSMAADSEYMAEEEIGEEMTHLAELRTELQRVEETMSGEISELEKQLTTLKNTVHVKKIMYEHLKQQLSTTRQEWSEAYEEYTAIETKKKQTLEKRTQQIQDIRERIEAVGRRIRSRVDQLDLKKMSEKASEH